MLPDEKGLIDLLEQILANTKKPGPEPGFFMSVSKLLKAKLLMDKNRINKHFVNYLLSSRPANEDPWCGVRSINKT